MKKIAKSGFTLVEMLIVIVILGIVAKVAIPMLSSNDPQKLSVAAEETANLLRFALSEANRTGGYVLVDGKTTSGQLALYYSNASAQIPPSVGTAAVIDPLTKRAMVLDITNSAFSQGVTLTPIFMFSMSNSATQLLIGPGTANLEVFNGSSVDKGPLYPNSQVLLSYGSQSIAVSINEITKLVTLP